MKHRRQPSTLIAVLIAGAVLALAGAPAVAAPPMGKHYAVVLIMADPETGEIDAAPACLRFYRKEMCTEAGDCGPWEFVQKRPRRNQWIGTLDFLDEDGTAIHAEVRGMTERLGAGDSIGGTAYITAEGVEINAGFGGTRVSRAACLEFGLSDD